VTRPGHWPGALLLSFAILAAAPWSASGRARRADCCGPNDVLVSNNYFKPTIRRIRRGTVVTWVWVGGVPHNVVGLDHGSRVIFKSRTTWRAGYRFRSRFHQTGAFTILCAIHPDRMRMYVVVR
jgi:plastocyanin